VKVFLRGATFSSIGYFHCPVVEAADVISRTNGFRVAKKKQLQQAVRGGSWDYDISELFQCADRWGYDAAGGRNDAYSFRIARRKA
jgi:hypothetical protein